MDHAPPVQKPPSKTKAGPLRPPVASLVARVPGAALPMVGRMGCACGGTCPRCRAAPLPLTMGPPDSPQEIEADQFAARVLYGKPISLPRHSAGPHQHDQAAPAGVAEVLDQPGQALEAGVRDFMESRSGADFSRVRVHTDGRAASSAQEVGARAYTVGSDVVFAARHFQPGTLAGRQLLAHELVHVLQQRQSGPVLQRQTATTPAPAFSVVQADYAQMLNRALSNMTGRLLASTTLASVVQPMLASMAAQVVWRDELGVEHGGGAVNQAVPGATSGGTVTLRMVLDDVRDPPEAGQFISTGSQGDLVVKIRRNASVEALTEVVYHESMHMLSWLINRHGGSVTGVHDRWAVRGLDMSRYATQIAAIRRTLGVLADSTNARRQAGGRTEIAADRLDSMARWLMEEVQVRAETQVFQLASQVQSQRGRGAAVYLPTQQYGDINAGMVDRYVFEFSQVFEAADRSGLAAADRDMLRILMETLEGFYQIHVRRRFSLTAHMGIPRAPVDIPLPSLTPPSFLPRIEESVREAPF